MESFNDYLDLHDLLASSVRVPCKITVVLLNLGSVISGNHGPHVPTNTSLDLPLWLVRRLLSHKIVELECPKYYKKAYRETQIADPSVLNLHKMGPYFYYTGFKFAILRTPDAYEIFIILHQVLRLRLKNILDHSSNTLDAEKDDFYLTLDNLERHLYAVYNQQTKQYLNWQHKSHMEIRSINPGPKKRKINVPEDCLNE